MKVSKPDTSSFGAPRGVFGVRSGVFWKVFLVSTSIVFLVTGVLSVAVAPEVASIIICSLPMVLLAAVFVKMLRDANATSDDELQMFESGFVYRSRGKYHSCRWEEINELRRNPKTYELMWVGKKDGELIVFADQNMPETKLIVESFDAFVLDPKNRSKMGAEWDDYRAENSGDD